MIIIRFEEIRILFLRITEKRYLSDVFWSHKNGGGNKNFYLPDLILFFVFIIDFQEVGYLISIFGTITNNFSVINFFGIKS